LQKQYLNYTISSYLLSNFYVTKIYTTMNFIKSSIFYDYLYSPKSWLHKQNNKIKIYICFIQLFFLPYSSFIYLTIFSISLLLLYNSTYVPNSIKNYLKRMIIFFIIFLIINIEQRDLTKYNQVSHRQTLQIFPLNKFTLFNGKNGLKSSRFSSLYFYLPISIIRLLTINIIYLFFIKILLLTTHYNEIIKFILVKIKKHLKTPATILNLEVMISSQFLNIICYQIEILKIAYITRDIKLNMRHSIRESILTCILFIEQLILNIYQSIYTTSNTLYSREIKLYNLKFYN